MRRVTAAEGKGNERRGRKEDKKMEKGERGYKEGGMKTMG